MRLYKTIFICLIITTMAVGYVHQRIEIVKVGYNLQGNREQLSRLIDQNSKLVYNLSKLESPRYLLASLDSEKIKFAKDRVSGIKPYRIAHATLDAENTDEGFVGRFIDLFTLNAEAKSRE